MEWAPVTAATGALGPVIAKLAALLGVEYKLRWRTRRDVKFIRSKLMPVHSILWSIWEREELDAPCRALKMEALDLADDLDDAIHDFIFNLERSRRNERLVQTKSKASTFHDLKKRASDVSGRCRSKWKEKEKPAGDDSSPAGKPRAYPFVRKDVSELVGMADPRERLIEHLDGRASAQPQLRTAFIYGVAGTGKTTLADLVYKGIGSKFQTRAFVSVTQGGNMREVLTRILEEVGARSSVPLAGTQATTEEDLIDILSNFLKDKRYLVIIDDIWNQGEWEIILKSLPENNLGSRIVMTTRLYFRPIKHKYDPNVMWHAMLADQKSGKEWVNEVNGINIATEMVRMKVNLVGEGFDYEHPILKMCGGTPLAVVCMLSAVAQEREKQGQHANTCDVQDEIEKRVMENGIQNTPGFEALVESLQLSFDDLPNHMLKTCLLYYSIYPDGHEFGSKCTFVRRWISEGFVYTEEEGNSYFEELVNRGLTLWRMYPMMRNFLGWKSRQDNFVTCSFEITPSSRIRRLCICNSPRTSRDATMDLLSALDWDHIRSLIVCAGVERVPFDKLEGLRVLDLCDTKYILGDRWIHICGLVHLRHLLGLNGDAISELPPEIVRLQCLETFEERRDGLAPGLAGGFIGNLQQLKTLLLSGYAITQLPKEIGALHQLHTLRFRYTSISELPMEIRELQQLKILDISFMHITELPKEIGELQQLKTLDISNSQIRVLPKEIGELHQLKKLDISYTQITLLPKEIGKLQQLESLLMVGTKVAKIPREIGALKELKTLILDDLYVAPELPLEVSALVELPECIRQAVNKSGLVSELAGEMLSFRTSPWLGSGDEGLVVGGLVVGTKQMHIPVWIREHFNDLVSLDIRICKLDEQGLKLLQEMPELGDLRLRFEVVPREPLVITSQGFVMLQFLTVDSRVPRVTFKEGAMPKLRLLRFEFQFYAGPPNKDPMGINHLRELGQIDFECNENWYGGRDSPCIRPTIDVIKKEAQELPRSPRIYFCGREENMEQGETVEEWSSGEGEMEEEEWSSGEGEIQEDIHA